MPIQVKSYRALQAVSFSLLLALAACGGGSSATIALGTDCSQPKATDADGCAFVSLSDAPGDFISYTVNVTNLMLIRRDGTKVSVLPNATSVDFAQLTSLSEFLSMNAMPSGDYVSGVITLDYSGADIEAQDSTGAAVKLTPVDGNGVALTTLQLTIDLDSNHPLILVPGVPHLLNVDFNLDASNTVNSNNTVTVQPFLVASVDPATGVEQRLRGPLNSVDTGNGSFTLGLRPFQALTGDYGKFAIYTNSSTNYFINQQGFTGSAGLVALQTAGVTTAVMVQGKFDFTSHHFVADQVLGGSSVPGGTLDTTEGVVTSRSGSTITLRGTTLYRSGQSVIFRDTTTVTLGSGTVVHETDKPKTALDISDLSVGQRLLVFGTLTNTSASSLQMDATSGFALMELTHVDGGVVSNSGTDLTLDVQSIEDRPIGLFDFTGTGSDPSNYDIATSGGIAAGVATGDPVRAIGFASPFGSAPPDFTAHTIADYVNAGALISVVWSSPGTANAFSSLDASTGIVPNLTSSPVLHRLRQGGVVTNLNNLTNLPTIKGDILGLYAVLRDGKVQVYLSFPNFVSAIQAQMSGGAKVRGVFALGGFDDTSDVLTTDEVAIILQ